MHDRAAALISALELVPHPEGGYYREVFRSTTGVTPADGRTVRSALTTIYFLLVAGSPSRWHRVMSDEVWHFYEGDGLDLHVADPDGLSMHTTRLGRFGPEARPVQSVPAGTWQAAEPVGGYALAGCTVGPGFDFEDFVTLREVSALAAKIASLGPRAAQLV
jgi:predicted cupin superfamily sugar epimerase